MSGFRCYACLEVVNWLASRCPHCTTPLNWGGAPASHQSSSPRYTTTNNTSQSDDDFGAFVATAIVFGLLGAGLYYTWDWISALFHWIGSTHNDIRAFLVTILHKLF